MLLDREITFNIVDILEKTLALLKKSADITILLGSRIELAQVLNIPGIRYFIAICISDSVWSWSCNLDYDERIFPSGI